MIPAVDFHSDLCHTPFQMEHDDVILLEGNQTEEVVHILALDICHIEQNEGVCTGHLDLGELQDHNTMGDSQGSWHDELDLRQMLA
jgi:hypothetical protein